MKKVEEIIEELISRRGFDDLWYNINYETQEEIKEALYNIILK